MATMVNVGFIEINSCTLKRIEGYDEVAVRGVVCGEMNSLRGSAIPNWDALCTAIEMLFTSELAIQAIW